MNFIYSIFLSIFVGAIPMTISFFLPESDGKLVCLIFMGIIWGIGLIFFVTTFFQNMCLRQGQREWISSIRTREKQITLMEEQMEKFKTELGASLTKIYPDYEKEIFKTISPGDAKGIEIFMAKYPELKFNGVLENFTNKISGMIANIYTFKCRLEDTHEKIRDRQENGWYLLKFELPEEIKIHM